MSKNLAIRNFNNVPQATVTLFSRRLNSRIDFPGLLWGGYIRTALQPLQWDCSGFAQQNPESWHWTVHCWPITTPFPTFICMEANNDEVNLLTCAYRRDFIRLDDPHSTPPSTWSVGTKRGTSEFRSSSHSFCKQTSHIGFPMRLQRNL